MPAVVIDSTVGLTNASGVIPYRRAYPIGGYFPAVILVEPPPYLKLGGIVLHDSIEWSMQPAPLRTITVMLQPPGPQ